MQAPEVARSGTLVGIAQFVRDARGPPLAVGRMAVDADKIDHGVTKGKAVVVLHTWNDHLWAIGSKGEPPEAVTVSTPGDEETGDGDDDIQDKDAGPDGGEGADAFTGTGHEPVIGDGLVSGPEEKLTPDGNILLIVSFAMKSSHSRGSIRGIRPSTSRAITSP